MATLSTSASAPAGLLSAPKQIQIPLYCSVCPDHPRFSDVSHLLTHIASKGHLHHETQTKLKAHQDLAASIALQEYEQWYKDYSIEALLVERMKAKQLKEASRYKRGRTMSVASGPKAKKAKRSVANKFIKAEDDDYTPDFSALHGLFVSDNDMDLLDEILPSNEMMSLKGQVWPGMGKMDLANDEMKRTRNQRKPKSVVERMRRASEGIEPTQVVMTSQFDVERVKGVYDDESPVSDLEETPTPRKTTRQRRKKAQPLAQISANVPRGEIGRTARAASTTQSKPAKHRHVFESERNNSPFESLGRPFDGFPGSNKTELYHGESYPTPLQSSHGFNMRERLGISSAIPISRPHMLSPSPAGRDLSCHGLTGGDMTRNRYHGAPFLGNDGDISLGSFGPHGTPCMQGNSSVYQEGPRVPFAATAHYDTVGQDHYRLASNTSASSTHDELSSHTDGDDSFSNPGQGLFLNISNTSANPLFSQDRQFLNSYAQQLSGHSFEPAAFTPASQDMDYPQLAVSGRDRRHVGSTSVKIEPHMSSGLESQSFADTKGTGFDSKAFWGAPGSDADMSLHNHLHPGEVDI